MTAPTLSSPADPAAALALFSEHSAVHPVVVFKKSPTCPVSFTAEDEYNAWCAALADDAAITTTVIDVIAERTLARGLTAELDIQHESPQLLWFERGEVRWHGSHGAVTRQQLDELWSSSQS